jgi:hypothetical protein
METIPTITQSMDTLREPIKMPDISEEDKERFFKCLMADEAYEETIALLNGSFKVKFRAMAVAENTDVVNQVVADRRSGVAADHDAYFITISAYRMALSLLSVDGKQYSSITKDNFVASSENDSYVLARSKLMLSWPTAKLSVFLDAFQMFENKLIKLASEVQNPSFWKASA